MSSRMETIYAKSPVLLQNLAVSYKGWSFARKRYGRRYRRNVNDLMRSQWLSAEQFRVLQNRELKSLLAEAAQNVPYYRKLLGKLGSLVTSPTLKSLKEIPLLEKELLREHPDQFINRNRLKLGYEGGHTSGTSGTPLVWKYDLSSMQRMLALRERLYRWAGITRTNKSARFSGRILLGKHSGPPYWRYNAPEKQWLFSTYHITDQTCPAYYEALRKLDINYLDGYPSALFVLAKWINRHGLSGSWRPWAIIATAETLMDFQREQIEQAFGCRVFNYYSSSEGAPFVTQCCTGTLHLNPESGIIEFLRPDGSDAEPGQEAEMVVTSFFQRTMPLLRYRIGDVGVLAENQECPCGRQMPIIKYIAGRESEVLYSSQRGHIGSAGLSTLLYKIPSRLRHSQIEQVDVDSFIFRYVPLNEPLDEKERALVIQGLKDRLGDLAQIDLQAVDKIPKGPAGKSPLIIGLPASKRIER